MISRQGFFCEFKFFSQIEERVREGRRPPVPDIPLIVADYGVLLQSCWSQTDTRRPIMANVCDGFEALLSIPHQDLTDDSKSGPIFARPRSPHVQLVSESKRPQSTAVHPIREQVMDAKAKVEDLRGMAETVMKNAEEEFQSHARQLQEAREGIERALEGLRRANEKTKQ